MLAVCLPQATWASEIDIPMVDPSFSIRVEAKTWDSEIRNNYEVLAFHGACKLTQGELTATADEIILWVDRSGSRGMEHPGKAIVYLNGRAYIQYASGAALRDRRWMGRLFSLHPVECIGQKEKRYDIPDLDWTRGQVHPVQPAQYAAGNSTAGVTTAGTPGLQAPPLLSYPPNPAVGNRYLDSNASRAPANSIPAQPGAVAWSPDRQLQQPQALANSGPPNTQGSTRDSQYFPQGGLAVSQDGGSAYPANSLPAASSPAVGSQFGGPELLLPPPVATPGQAPPGLVQPPGGGLQPQTVLQVENIPFQAKSVQFLPRGSLEQEITPQYDEVRDETVTQIRGGFRFIVNGLGIPQANGSLTQIGGVSLEADNAVVWLRGRATMKDLVQTTSTADRPIELYMEGNIVFQQGNRVIYADRMYYNVSSEYGMILSAEVLTPVPQYEGLLRLKADVIQQRDRQHLLAYKAAVTSSRMGVPRYWLQADEVLLTDERSDAEAAGYVAPGIDNGTGLEAQAKNNFVYLAGMPILYWPTLTTDLTNSSFYLTSVKLKNDSIFGFQAYAEWDVFQLLGIEPYAGSSLHLSTDYLSERGPAVGLRYEYNRPTFIGGIPSTGFSDAWFINDSGLDQLGSDRIGLTPSVTNRGRILSRHWFYLSPDWEATFESGWISDDNFLEQYFENEWEQEKDATTALRLRHYNGNQQFDIYGQIRVNDFFTETESLPRIDHYWIGQDLFRELFTWSAQTSVSYSHMKTASTPTDPVDAAKFALLPWETDSEGLRAITRQELSMPLALGAFKVIPFVSGEAGFWNEDINQDDLTRLTGQAGVRAALPMWRDYPNFENRLFDLRGLAHKVTFQSEFFYADSSQDLDLLPLYDKLDDNSQEHFRRRMVFNTFAGSLPPEFDERSFAFRSGMQRWVTAGSKEIVDDLSQVRLGVNQRWQTKRGLAGRERIVDLVALDVDFVYFPNEERDNFGEDVGVMNYDFRYHVGDRLTILSDGYFDVFSQGLKMMSAGAQMSRPGRGDAYIGMTSIEGPISANILNGFVNYRLNEKWIVNGGASFDFGEAGSIGQTFGLTRIGESALVRVGFNVDSGRDNVSVNFAIEPRFFQRGLLGGLGGELVSPAGSRGLE